MRLSCGLMEGQIWDAVVRSSPKEGLETETVIVLSNDEVLFPADADFGEFAIVDATEEERERLKQAGYSMPDWTPLHGLGCAGHADHIESHTPPTETVEPEP